MNSHKVVLLNTDQRTAKQKLVSVSDYNSLWDDVKTLETIISLIDSGSGEISSQYVYLTDGVSIFRFGVRNPMLCVDIVLTPTGFDGTEDVDWKNLYSFANEE